MDIEVLVWTLIFFGGNLLILLFLLFWAVRKDREKGREKDREEGRTARGTGAAEAGD